MEAKKGSFGSSLIVPCVQELVKDPMINVPPRYIRADLDSSLISDDDLVDVVPRVPVIDLNNLVSHESMDGELSKLHFACKEWGFFQLVNHGVSTSIIKKMKVDVQDFFGLPMEEKKKFWQFPGEVEGFGQAFVVSEEQKLDWDDLFFMVTQPPHLRKPHLFPNLPPAFRESLEVYSLEVKNVATSIIDYIAKALNIRDEEMKQIFGDVRQSMRMNYYPPCPQPEKVIGLTPHSDATGLTILLQVNDVQGLQIRKEGKWVSIKPLQNAFVVNIGDILEIVTNGKYRSIEHRALVNSAKERLSIAAFHAPAYNGIILPAASLITEESPALFKELGVQEYFKGLFSRELRGKSYLDSLRID